MATSYLYEPKRPRLQMPCFFNHGSASANTLHNEEGEGSGINEGKVTTMNGIRGGAL